MASLVTALDILDSVPGVIQSGLISDHLRVITQMDMNNEEFQNALLSAGIKVSRAEQVEPSLEDVFLALAGDRGKSDV
jgi:hypothetical protein